MLRSLKELEGYTISAIDGDIGTVTNFLIDNRHWTVRYLVAETGTFFHDRKVLISPISFREIDWSTRQFHVALTVDKVKNGPTIDADQPVSRQHEREYHRYYDYPFYWGETGIWGMGDYPGVLAVRRWSDEPSREPEPPADQRLRSVRELRGYAIQGTDKEVGRVVDFIVHDETWTVRYLVIDTSTWWFGKKVLVAPDWATRVSWEEQKVHLDLDTQRIKDSPAWDPSAPVNREYEARLYDFYGRPVYWEVGKPPARRSREEQHPSTH